MNSVEAVSAVFYSLVQLSEFDLTWLDFDLKVWKTGKCRKNGHNKLSFPSQERRSSSVWQLQNYCTGIACKQDSVVGDSLLEEETVQEQAGFRSKRDTRDEIVNLRIILERAREIKQSFYLCFVDFIKAFDMVRHDQLWLNRRYNKLTISMG